MHQSYLGQWLKPQILETTPRVAKSKFLVIKYIHVPNEFHCSLKFKNNRQGASVLSNPLSIISWASSPFTQPSYTLYIHSFIHFVNKMDKTLRFMNLMF